MNGIPAWKRLESAQNVNPPIGMLKENIKKSRSRLIDETGNKYNMLTVIRYAGSGKMFGTGKHDGGAAWLCKCDCWKETVALGTKLRMGIIKSCGNHWELKSGEASLNAKISVMKHSAKRRGYSWELTKKQTVALLTGNCVYCGVKPSVLSRGRTCKDPFVCNGIDRIDNDKSYTFENSVSCCPDCNRAKRIMSVAEFISWFKRIAEFNNWECKTDTMSFSMGK